MSNCHRQFREWYLLLFSYEIITSVNHYVTLNTGIGLLMKDDPGPVTFD